MVAGSVFQRTVARKLSSQKQAGCKSVSSRSPALAKLCIVLRLCCGGEVWNEFEVVEPFLMCPDETYASMTKNAGPVVVPIVGILKMQDQLICEYNLEFTLREWINGHRRLLYIHTEPGLMCYLVGTSSKFL
jgi:hypothetical protein